MVVLIIAPPAAHIRNVSDARTQTEDTLLFTAKGRKFWPVIRHEEDPSRYPCCYRTIYQVSCTCAV